MTQAHVTLEDPVRTPLKTRDRVDILLKEYDALRAETVTRVTTRFGVVGVMAGVITLALTTDQEPPTDRWLVVLALGIGGIWYWIGRLMSKCKIRLEEIEKQINARAGEVLMTWEHVHCKGRVFDWMYPPPRQLEPTVVTRASMGLDDDGSGAIKPPSAGPTE